MNSPKKPDPTGKRTLKRDQRLQHAAHWLPTVSFTGKRLVHAYAKKYNTDLLCSLGELRVLGVAISSEYEVALKRSQEQRLAKLNEGKAEKQKPSDPGYPDFDENFAFIAGYTNGGSPFRVSWERETFGFTNYTFEDFF